MKNQWISYRTPIWNVAGRDVTTSKNKITLPQTSNLMLAERDEFNNVLKLNVSNQVFDEKCRVKLL